MHQNDENENKQLNETKIIELKVYYDDDYEHEIYFNEFVWYVFDIKNNQFSINN